MENIMSENYTFFNHSASVGMRSLFYAVTPSESSFQREEDVPKYVFKASPYFFALIVIEFIINTLKGDHHKTPRYNDAFSSLSAGVMSQLPLIFARSVEFSTYCWAHKRFLIYELPWDHPATWILTLFAVDFCFYWVHRLTHEVNFIWATHQVHHSSEDYNLTTALRQPLLQRYCTWMIYLPLALFIPPTQFLVHTQFNLLYQFWIHTEVVNKLGPLELILNTPSHHRVHHARNRYCIDKNYAGVFIIWDRMFGTFAEEKSCEEISYGLVHPLKSWDPNYIQFSSYLSLYRRFKRITGWRNKLNVLIMGPGWSPGKPRLGLRTDIPDNMSSWLCVYTVVFILWTMTNIGFFYEHKRFAPICELVRCCVYLAADGITCYNDVCANWLYIPRVLFTLSSSVWLVWCARNLQKKEH